jgi:uncharacterized membrane protein
MEHPPKPAGAGRDAVLEQRVGSILRAGVYLSTACLAVGVTVSFVLGQGQVAVVLMNAGLMILMATPVARVVASVAEYARERDWTFVLLTSIVLLELSAGIIAALVFHRRL